MRQLKITKSITNRETQSLAKYLNDISREGMITPEEEVKLAKKIKKGDWKALKSLVKANLRFVVSVSKQYQGQGLSLVDLINEGNMGLIKAAKRFDHTRGFKFISYAVWWIRQSILQAMAQQSRTIRLPLNKIGALGKIKKAYSKLEQKLQREPNSAELSNALDLTHDQIKDALYVSGRELSVDAPFVDGESNTLLDVIVNKDSPKADKTLMEESLRKEIDRSLSTLTEQEADVIKMFFGIGHKHDSSLEVIGLKYSLTRERVRQIKEKALIKLKHHSRNRLLKTYLG